LEYGHFKLGLFLQTETETKETGGATITENNVMIFKCFCKITGEKNGENGENGPFNTKYS
jgi:hypothetical protein